jgi:uncharacterized protein (DUF1501 family)
MQVDKLVMNLHHPSLARSEQREQLDLLKQLNELHLAGRPHDAALETQIQAMETAFQMQSEAAEAFDISREPESIREAYGKTNFGQQCLLARRLCERGVRYVHVYYLSKDNNQPWDTHTNNDEGHRKLCKDADQATAEIQEKSKNGRDHHHTGFSVFLAGGGVKGGLMYGATDELGMHAVENRVHVHDLHATILHLLGLDHERLTYHYSGRNFRLTDVHGRVVHDILA